MDREDAIDEITARAKVARTRPSRSLWIAALVLGVGCAIALAVAWFSNTRATPSPQVNRHDIGLGFSTGLVVGIGIGIAIGWMARANPVRALLGRRRG